MEGLEPKKNPLNSGLDQNQGVFAAFPNVLTLSIQYQVFKTYYMKSQVVYKQKTLPHALQALSHTHSGSELMIEKGC